MLKLGDTASIQKEFSDSDVRTFADISGDQNPIHLDETYATSTRFKHRIVHGMLTSSLISAVLGMVLPGPGSIYYAVGSNRPLVGDYFNNLWALKIDIGYTSKSIDFYSEFCGNPSQSPDRRPGKQNSVSRIVSTHFYALGV